MRSLALLSLCMLLGFTTYSQRLFSKDKIINTVDNIDQKRWTWGYYLGFNQFDFNFDYEAENALGQQQQEILVNNNLSFNVGLLGNLKINKYVDLRFEPGVIFANREVIFPNDEANAREVKSTYVHLPLLLKFSTKRINNFKPFIIGGLSTAINLSSNEDNPDDNQAGQFRMTTNNYFYEIGFGVDLYLHFFKLTPSIRGIFALNDELVRDNDPNSLFTSGIQKMGTRGIFLNFTFQ
ncbi:porin family protein [Gangjinia marincola]|uniref:Porin family protein n=1 Tax=Gangjinia marincola TaxID=578463 RepID=A0ABN1MJB2_9FLAO